MTSATLNVPSLVPARIGGAIHEYRWQYQGQASGGLDLAATREAFLQPLQNLNTPLMVLIGDRSPAASKAEMDALAAQSNIQREHLSGSPGLHEEYAAEVATPTLPFLR